MISVVIPAYNAGKYLAETVKSVQAQTFTAWEILIVDDGSKDDSIAIAEELHRQDSRISVFSQKNGGAAVARNHGLSKSNPAYPFVLFLDSDDLLLPEALKTLLSLLEAHPDAPAACGFLKDIDAEGAIIPYHRFEPMPERRGIEGSKLVHRDADAPVVFGDLCFYNHIVTPGMVLIRKTAIKITGDFNTSLVYVEDYDLWWRLTMNVGSILVTSEPVLLYRHHGTSISRNKTAVKRGQTAWRWNLLTHPGMTPEQKRLGRIGHFYRCLVSWEFGLFVIRRGDTRHGIKLILMGILAMLYFIRDLFRARRQPRALNQSG